MTRRMAVVTKPAVLIIDLLDVPKMDGSAALAIEEIIERARQAQQDVILVGLNCAVARLFGQLGILNLIKETHRFTTRLEAVAAAVARLEERDERALATPRAV